MGLVGWEANIYSAREGTGELPGIISAFRFSGCQHVIVDQLLASTIITFFSIYNFVISRVEVAAYHLPSS
jgi:hypothetical protein